MWKHFLKPLVAAEIAKLKEEYARASAAAPVAPPSTAFPAAAHPAAPPTPATFSLAGAGPMAPRPETGSASPGYQNSEGSSPAPRSFPSVSGAALAPAPPPTANGRPKRGRSVSSGEDGSGSEGDDGPQLPGEASRAAAGMGWMTNAPESMAGMFGQEANKGRKGGMKADPHEVERSAAEVAEFQKQFADKPSLTDQVRSGTVGDANSLRSGRRIGQKRFEGDDAWGMRPGEQEMLEKRQRAEDEAEKDPSKRPRKMFDPQKDLPTRRPVDGAAFEKMLKDDDNSLLKSRFGKSQVSSSFL